MSDKQSDTRPAPAGITPKPSEPAPPRALDAAELAAVGGGAARRGVILTD